MKKWKLIAGVLLIFVSGVLLGSLGSGWYHRKLYDRFGKDSAERKRYILKKFTERLALAEDQQNRFKAVIDRIEAQRKAQTQAHRSEVRKIMEASYVDMKKVLTPEQQNRFDELIQEIRKQRQSIKRQRN